jgi:hypothetical protein
MAMLQVNQLSLMAPPGRAVGHSQIMKIRLTWLGWLLVAVATLYGVGLLLHPPLMCFPLKVGGTAELWDSALWRTLRWPLVVAGVLCSGVLWSIRRTFRPALPFMFVPWLGIIVLLGDHLPAGVKSNSIFLAGMGIIVCLALLNAGATTSCEQASQAGFGLRIFLFSWLIYSLTGLWTVRWIDEKYGGDERAYLTEAVSLWEDGDLDLRNNCWQLGNHIKADEIHVSPNSTMGRWYSWHPYGLSLILAPFSHAGREVRVLVLAVFGALANLGMYRLCRLAGATNRSSILVVAVLGGSICWAFYATRVFTEMLGAALLVWLFVAAWEQNRYPWCATLLAGVCGGYLALTQLRYLPVSAFGLAVFSWLAIVRRGESVRSKLCRLAVLAGIAGMAYIVLFVSQVVMFGPGKEGPALLRWTIGAMINSTVPADASMAGAAQPQLSGLWISLLDTMGLVSVLPVFLFMATAAILAGFRGGASRGLAIVALCAFGIAWVTSCTNTFCVGFGAIPGRYLIVALPMLVPATACALDRASGSARAWFVFLGAWSIVLLVLGLAKLPILGNNFLLPIHGLAKIDPLFSGLFHPHARFLDADSGIARMATVAYALGVMLVTATLLYTSAEKRALGAAAWVVGLLLAAAAHATQTGLPHFVAKQEEFARRLLEKDRDKVRIRLCNTPYELIKDLAWLNLAPGPLVVTTRDLGAPRVKGVLSEPRIEINDWAGRDIRWATLFAPFAPDPGSYLLELGAEVKKAAEGPTLAIREGTNTLYEAPLPVENDRIHETLEFHCRGRSGDLYILLSLRGESAKFISSTST